MISEYSKKNRNMCYRVFAPFNENSNYAQYLSDSNWNDMYSNVLNLTNYSSVEKPLCIEYNSIISKIIFELDKTIPVILN